MAEPTAVMALSILISGLGVLTTVAMMRSYQIDKFREEIFTLREELFLYSIDEGLLDSPAHRNLRNLLNSLLRYAHKVTFTHVVALQTTKWLLQMDFAHEANPMEDWKRAVGDLPDHQQERMNYINRKTIELVIKHIILRSFFFWIFAVCVLGSRLAVGRLAASRDVIKASIRSLVPINLLEAEALRATDMLHKAANYS